MANRSTVDPNLTKTVRAWHTRQVKWRRHLHRYPEIANQENETTAFLKAELKKLGLKILPLKMKTGVLAELKGGRSGPTVAVRSDIDALPIQETTGLPFASRITDRMHACGHDLHMAIALGAAGVLAERRAELAGRVRFIFQPAEEEPPGGAKFMIENDALKDVRMIFGLHVDPQFPVGTVALCDGPMMASVHDFDLIIHGRGGHAARPQLAVDTVVTAAEVVESLQKIVSRNTDPATPLVITIGKIEGGSARNVIADKTSLLCTARTLSKPLSKKLPSMIKRTVGGVCKAHGATFEINELASYPILTNSAATNKLYARVFGGLFGKSKVRVADPILGGEDFAYYVQKVPGAMCRLGVRNKKIGADQSWHSPRFVADEEALFYGTALLTGAALEYFDGAAG
jgi:amidohydrolase